MSDGVGILCVGSWEFLQTRCPCYAKMKKTFVFLGVSVTERMQSLYSFRDSCVTDSTHTAVHEEKVIWQGAFCRPIHMPKPKIDPPSRLSLPTNP